MKDYILILMCAFVCAGCSTVVEDPFEGALADEGTDEALWTPFEEEEKAEEEAEEEKALLVDVECAFIELNDASARPLLSEGLSAEMILGLVKKGKATVLSAPMVRSESGQDAEAKAVEEYIFPSEFDITPVSGSEEVFKKAEILRGVSVEPGSFETREVGAILQVTPEVAGDRKTISLGLSPELVLPPVWRNYGSEVETAEGHKSRTKIEQPFFRAMRFTSTVVLQDGESALLGGGAMNPASEKSVYAVVTVKIVK